MDLIDNILISTPLDTDKPKFTITGISGTETLSDLFFYTLALESKDDNIDFDKLLGESVTVTIINQNTKEYYINGVVSRMMMRERGTLTTQYIAEIRPWFWKLTLIRDSRIFQNKKVTEIIADLFSKNGFTDFEDKTTGSYTERIYCVQYMETSFNFISRLMEEEGIFYFFEHAKGKHTLIFADDMDAHKDCPALDEAVIGKSFVKHCSLISSVTSNKYAVNDYNFETPDTDLTSAAGAPKGDAYRVYEYPAKYSESSQGENIGKKRLEAVSALGKMISGESTYRTFNAGYKFKLKNHQRADMNISYVLYRVWINASITEYGNRFEAFPADIPFRPMIKTAKPRIYGTQTAKVVGKSGEEIWTDKYGRIKVQFHWDQEGKNDENSSCWIRVMQFWGGKDWGALFTPRIGTEVIVTFLEGDPDQPVVTGTIYNAIETVPYALPSNQNISTIKTRSTKSGAAGNEIRFTDTKESEELFIHAQKDMNSVVENQRTATIKESNEILTVEKGDRMVKVNTGKETHEVKGTRTLKVTGNEDHNDEANFDHNVKGNYTMNVDGNLTIKVKGSINIKSDMDITGNAGTSISTRAGTSIKNEAGTTFDNKAGVAMTNDGGVNLTDKASAMVKIDGGGMLTCSAGMIKLN
jgi:type VI secretion system secreted protein VgrG